MVMIFFNRDLCYVNIFWTATGDNFNKFSTINAVNLDLDLVVVVFLASWFRLFMSTFIFAILRQTESSCWRHSNISSWHRMGCDVSCDGWMTTTYFGWMNISMCKRCSNVVDEMFAISLSQKLIKISFFSGDKHAIIYSLCQFYYR